MTTQLDTASTMQRSSSSRRALMEVVLAAGLSIISLVAFFPAAILIGSVSSLALVGRRRSVDDESARRSYTTGAIVCAVVSVLAILASVFLLGASDTAA